jgi:hypothetical protein
VTRGEHPGADAASDERDRSLRGAGDPFSGGVHTFAAQGMRHPDDDVGGIFAGGEDTGWPAPDQHGIAHDPAQTLDGE